MSKTEYQFTIQTSNQGELNITLTEGEAVFVLGANGVGKSALMNKLFQQNLYHSKIILAHRQTWFTNISMDMTVSQKEKLEHDIKHEGFKPDSRWKNDYSQAKSSISIFDLINSENRRARNIASAVDENDLPSAENLSNNQAPIQAINELLAISNIPIIITLEEDGQLFASKNGSESYSISELSDGERNTLLICADVLTTEPNRLIILDEPERHLHPSIISPLLSSLFQKRRDCVFVISTHNISLPVDHKESSVLLLRGCQWNGKSIQDWDADLIKGSDEISNEVKREILGSKKDILFVEGSNGSLDRQIYQLIFPAMTISAQGSCTQVEKAVKGIRETNNLHWINAFGLIDVDNRAQEDVEKLLDKGIAALKCYSVESLYYNLEIVKRIAKRCSESTGKNVNELYERAISGIIENILPHKDILCSRLCEKQVRKQIMQSLPKCEDIINKGRFIKELNLEVFMKKEEALFDKLISDYDLNGLIERYPVRETQVLTEIAKGLGLKRDTYESEVRRLIIEDSTTKKFYENLLSDLTKLIIGEPKRIPSAETTKSRPELVRESQ